MPISGINHEQVLIALDKVDGINFEKFVFGFYPELSGFDFIPLGGNKDGGADGFLDINIFGALKHEKLFLQASITEDYRTKIRNTISRLREVGRNPNSLIYITSRRVNNIDIEEEKLSEELAVNIKIRDKNYIVSNINRSINTITAYRTYLEPQLEYLKNISSGGLIVTSSLSASTDIYVFLRQEIERRKGKESLINALADGLILWALEGTDPDKGIFLKKDEIIYKIDQEVPTARNILKGVITKRIEYLSSGMKSAERPVRWHKKDNKFCLAYEHRKIILDENTIDQALRISVMDSFNTRISRNCKDTLNIEEISLAVEVSLESICRTFESEGIEFADFLQTTEPRMSPKYISDHVDACMKAKSVCSELENRLRVPILENLRDAFFNSTPEERQYFQRLSSTYTLFFCLNSDPRIIEFFQNMAADFYLFVGSDIFVQVLCEICLNNEDQLMTNTLKIIKDAGGKLALTEQVLDEVYGHITSSDYEYINNYKEIDQFIEETIAENAKPLIRAYYLNKKSRSTSGECCMSWGSFVNRFCDYDILHNDEGKEQLRRFLQSKFRMDYFSEEEMMKNYSNKDVDDLTEKFLEEKKDPRLAKNDAELVLAVYGRRKLNQESSALNEYGYRTWWLTNQRRILKHTEDLVIKYRAKYMIRPEFILNFITLSPKTSDVYNLYRKVFPSILGIQIAKRVDPIQISNVLKKVREANQLEPSRKFAVIQQLTDDLKSDFFKKYN